MVGVQEGPSTESPSVRADPGRYYASPGHYIIRIPCQQCAACHVAREDLARQPQKAFCTQMYMSAKRHSHTCSHTLGTVAWVCNDDLQNQVHMGTVASSRLWNGCMVCNKDVCLLPAVQLAGSAACQPTVQHSGMLSVHITLYLYVTAELQNSTHSNGESSK